MVAILREGKSLPVRYSAIECLLLSVSKNKRTMSTSSGKLGNITSRDCLGDTFSAILLASFGKTARVFRV